MSNTKKITVCAMMIALATVLAWISNALPFKWLQGGSITLASMVPIIVASIITGPKWGLLSGLVYSILQILLGGGVMTPPVQNFISYLLVVMLDYVIAFGVLGLAGLFYNMMGKKNYAMPVSALIVTFLRFVCHFLSGIIIWGVYAQEGQSVMVYSLVYNGGYMVPEIIITTVVVALLIPVINKLKAN